MSITTYTYNKGGYTHTYTYMPKAQKIGNYRLKHEYNVDINAYEIDVKKKMKAKDLSVKYKIPYSVAVKLKNAMLEEILSKALNEHIITNSIPCEI